MMKKLIKTKQAPEAIGAYSQAVEKDGILFISGQLPINPETNEMSDDILEQTRQSLENIKAILEEAEMNVDNVVKNTIYVTSLKQAAEINEVYAEFFEKSKPSRAMVGVKELPKGALIEVDSIAIK